MSYQWFVTTLKKLGNISAVKKCKFTGPLFAACCKGSQNTVLKLYSKASAHCKPVTDKKRGPEHGVKKCEHEARMV
jgi:hypothetical protein